MFNYNVWIHLTNSWQQTTKTFLMEKMQAKRLWETWAILREFIEDLSNILRETWVSQKTLFLINNGINKYNLSKFNLMQKFLFFNQGYLNIDVPFMWMQHDFGFQTSDLVL